MKKFVNIITYIKLKYVFYILTIAVCILSVGLIDKSFWSNLSDSIKTTLESTKPTEELFDDTSGVKLINVLFGENSCLVSTTPIDYDLKFAYYDNIVNNDGIMTVVGASGILYSPYAGTVDINHFTDGNCELIIDHGNNLHSVFSGQLGIGVKVGDYVQKGQPIALLLGDIQYYLKQGSDIIDNIESSGDAIWQS